MADEYESKFMAEGEPRFREKNVSRVLVALMAPFALLALGVGAFAVYSAGPIAALGPLVAAGIVGLTTLYFAVMRTTVDATHVSVQYGTLGPRVALGDVQSAELVKLTALERLAFGPKWRGPGSWSYISAGQAEGVRVRYRSGGRTAEVLVGATDAAGLLAAIEEGRRGRAAPVRVRVEAGAGESPVEEEAVEAERRAQSKHRSA